MRTSVPQAYRGVAVGEGVRVEVCDGVAVGVWVAVWVGMPVAVGVKVFVAVLAGKLV